MKRSIKTSDIAAPAALVQWSAFGRCCGARSAFKSCWEARACGRWTIASHGNRSAVPFGPPALEHPSSRRTRVLFDERRKTAITKTEENKKRGRINAAVEGKGSKERKRGWTTHLAFSFTKNGWRCMKGLRSSCVSRSSVLNEFKMSSWSALDESRIGYGSSLSCNFKISLSFEGGQNSLAATPSGP